MNQLFSLPNDVVASIGDFMSALFSSIWVYVALVIGILVGLWLLDELLNLIRGNKEN